MDVIARYIKSYGGIVGPDDLTLLQKLFDEVCLARGYPPDGEDAEYYGPVDCYPVPERHCR